MTNPKIDYTYSDTKTHGNLNIDNLQKQQII
jgi:hypothetical protein